MVHYTFDDKTKTTRCILTVSQSSGKVSGHFIGKAVCNPDDKFNKELGKQIAYKRAMIKLKKAEVKFHKMGMKVYSEPNRLYNLHSKAVENNTKRIVELNEELNSLFQH